MEFPETIFSENFYLHPESYSSQQKLDEIFAKKQQLVSICLQI